jgi:hypothetical protein
MLPRNKDVDGYLLKVTDPMKMKRNRVPQQVIANTASLHILAICRHNRSGAAFSMDVFTWSRAFDNASADLKTYGGDSAVVNSGRGGCSVRPRQPGSRLRLEGGSFRQSMSSPAVFDVIDTAASGRGTQTRSLTLSVHCR